MLTKKNTLNTSATRVRDDDDEQEQLNYIARQYRMHPSLVRDAKKAFDHYCERSSLQKKGKVAKRRHSATPSTAAQVSSQPSTPSRKASCITAEMRKKNDDSDETRPLLGVSGVAAFLHDMNISMSLSRVKDLVQRMCATPPEMAQLSRDEAARQTGTRGAAVSSGAAAAGVSDTTVSAATTTSSAPTQTQMQMGLDFEAFVQLLCMRWTEEDYQATEMEAEATAMLGVLDHDGDGVLSERDIRKHVQHILNARQRQDAGNVVGDTAASGGGGCGVGYDDEVCKLADMHSMELRIALQTCDMDGDGYVTLPDLMALLRA